MRFQAGRCCWLFTWTLSLISCGEIDTPPSAAKTSQQQTGLVSATLATQLFVPPTGDGAPQDHFGSAVAVSGNTAVVGVEGEDVNLNSDGTAYFFVRSNGLWVQQAKVVCPDPQLANAAFFGYAVAIDGDTAVIAAPNVARGYVYVRTGSSWSLEATLVAADVRSVAIDGDTIVIGGPNDGTPVQQAGSVSVFTRTAGIWTQSVKLYKPTTAANGDKFGTAVALQGNTLVVSAPNVNTPLGNDAGSAYVYTGAGATWTLEATLSASDGGQGERFGSAVSLDNEALVIGAPGEPAFPGTGTDLGSVYVFTRVGTTWTQQSKIVASNGALDDQFGRALALFDNRLVVPVREGDPPSTLPPRVYVYTRTGVTWSEEILTLSLPSPQAGSSTVALVDEEVLLGLPQRATEAGPGAGGVQILSHATGAWLQTQLLTHGNAVAQDLFGQQLAMDGDLLAVGAPYADSALAENGGCVYLFFKDAAGTWTLETQIVEPTPGSNRLFGSSLALSGNTLAVSYPVDTSASGRIYVFRRSNGTWTQEAMLTAPTPEVDDSFGESIALQGDLLATGKQTLATGSAFIFTRSGTTWTLETTLTAPSGNASDLFGLPVALDGNSLAVGARHEKSAGWNAGAVYVFVKSGTGWTQQAKLTVSDAAPWDGFAYAKLSGDTLLASIPAKDYVGRAYVFVRNGSNWSQQAILTPSTPTAYAYFGGSLALHGDVAAIGAPTSSSTLTGYATIFERNGTSWIEQVLIPGTQPGESIGSSVALNADTAVIGRRELTPVPESAYFKSGAVDVYSLTGVGGVGGVGGADGGSGVGGVGGGSAGAGGSSGAAQGGSAGIGSGGTAQDSGVDGTAGRSSGGAAGQSGIGGSVFGGAAGTGATGATGSGGIGGEALGGGNGGSSGASGGSMATGGEDGGCGCRQTSSRGSSWAWVALGGLLLTIRRRGRHGSSLELDGLHDRRK